MHIRAVESLGVLQLPEAATVPQQALADRNSGVRMWATEVMGCGLSKDFE